MNFSKEILYNRAMKQYESFQKQKSGQPQSSNQIENDVTGYMMTSQGAFSGYIQPTQQEIHASGDIRMKTAPYGSR
jgi:hypothetical protein